MTFGVQHSVLELFGSILFLITDLLLRDITAGKKASATLKSVNRSNKFGREVDLRLWRIN